MVDGAVIYECKSQKGSSALKIGDYYLTTGSVFEKYLENSNSQSFKFEAYFSTASIAKVTPVFPIGKFESSDVRFSFQQAGKFRLNGQQQGLLPSCFGIFILFGHSEENDAGDVVLRFLKYSVPLRGGGIIGASILIVSTPFSLPTFLNSESRGIVGNIFGKDGCMFLTDAKMAEGCEGAPVRLLNGPLIGLILHPIVWYGQEWMGFTLAASLHHVLQSWLHSLTNQIIPLSRCQVHSLGDCIHVEMNSIGVVEVTSGNSRGSGLLFSKERGVIITCSHVVQFEKGEVTLRYKKESFSGHVLFASSSDSNFDVAVIGAPPFRLSNIPEFEISTQKPQPGDKVYAAGYSLFSLENDLVEGPSITSGYVTKLAGQDIIYSDCGTNSGCSGGALILPNGHLLGMITHNVTNRGIIVPNITIATPVSLFENAIRQLCQSGSKQI